MIDIKTYLFEEARRNNTYLYAIIDSAVDGMIDGHFESDEPVFPPQEESKYHEFVRLTLKAAQKHGLHTEKACYVYIMAWHIMGADILRIEWLQKILKDEEVFAEEKVEALQKAIDKTITLRAKEVVPLQHQ